MELMTLYRLYQPKVTPSFFVDVLALDEIEWKNEILTFAALLIRKELPQFPFAFVAAKKARCDYWEQKRCRFKRSVDSISPILAPLHVSSILEDLKQVARLRTNFSAKCVAELCNPPPIVIVVKMGVTEKPDRALSRRPLGLATLLHVFSLPASQYGDALQNGALKFSW